ncbi:kinase-like domain-containing protein [Phakopsora pachyrhizi]|nr:kinase-like domain-containing protein [Phakopsora pachyrhizi]
MISDTFKQNKEQQQAFQSLEFPKPDNVDGGMVSRIRKRRLKPSLLDTSRFKPTKRKRAKIELDSVSDCDRLRDEAGRLKTTDSDDRTKVLIIKVGEEPWRIGRSLEADLTIRSPTVSSWHCKLYAIECDTGERLVCLEDTSTNGVKLNDKIIHNRAVILNNHDRLKISDQEFVYLHTWPAGQWQGLNGSSINPSSSLLNISRFNPILIGNYKITERVLGSGFFSVVHLAIHRFDQSQVACKILRKTKRSSLPISSKASMAKGSDRRVFELERLRFKNLVEKEVKLNASLDHPNINKIIDLEQDPERIYLFLELVTGGDLFGYIVRKKKLSSDESKFILFQLVLGLQYMHDIKGISHRDIKPENILLTNHGPEPRVLISDFGAARLSDRAFLSMQGTMSYSAPVESPTPLRI